LTKNHPNYSKVPAGPLATGGIVDGSGKRWIDIPRGIEGLFLQNTDPFISDSDTNMWEKALPHLKFAVAIDVFISSTHELFPTGSYVLPECTFLERTDAAAPTATATTVNVINKVVDPLHNSKSAYWILVSLAAKISELFGSEDSVPANKYFAKNAPVASYTLNAGSGRLHKLDTNREEDFIAAQWNNFDSQTWADLKAAGGRWKTNYHATSAPTVRYAFTAATSGSTVNVRQIRQELENTSATTFSTPFVPHWIPPVPTTEKFPLRYMAGGKVMWHTMGATSNLPYLVQDFAKEAPVRNTNCLMINPADATARGIADGAWVFVASAAGRIRVQAWVTARIREGFVSLFSGFGHKAPSMKTANQRGTNPAYLISSLRLDKGTGAATSNEEPVQVFKA
jgi:thiosulfate reductase/polysulfide reductase chain A